MKLYELIEAYERVRELMEEDEGRGNWEDALLQIEDSMDDKAVNIACLITELEAKWVAYDNQELRMSYRKETTQKQIARLKFMAQTAMESRGITKLKGNTISITLQNSPLSVDVVNESLVPSNFKRARLDMPLNEVPEDLVWRANVSVNKAEILKALKDGAEVQGTRVVQNQHIRIR